MSFLNQNIFKRGNLLVPSVEFEAEGQGIRFYSIKTFTKGNGEIIEDISISLHCDGNKTHISCTCSHCSIFEGVSPEVLCSYKVALIKSLPLK